MISFLVTVKFKQSGMGGMRGGTVSQQYASVDSEEELAKCNGHVRECRGWRNERNG